ncbi:mannitol dehydrogenase family protein [Leekyejoonella antrihumi]|uniref:mannitol dehydrogenase family protein n=1 Tax=Leekyejoonella antrihumi TaxID=1660198 RepID=UPI001C94F157|nr:mannitol dehydrogenase family protein [Leekyejoonella antrihumi]
MRILHVGLGNFFRAHQAWYTDRVDDAGEWGIAAFAGRSHEDGRGEIVEAMSGQDCLYTLVTKYPDRLTADVISSVVAVHGAGEHDAWLRYFASPDLALVTLTVTEAAYLHTSTGTDLTNTAVQQDIRALRRDVRAPVGTVPARLVAGLAARRAAAAGPLAVVPCDNLPSNGRVAANVVTSVAEQVDGDLARWIEREVSWVTSMVDRITPRPTAADRAQVLHDTGVADPAVVVSEPFSEWTLQGRFPAGRPEWTRAGARVVDDVTPYEQRKLWLLNGAHSLLAYAGSILGLETVDQAAGDPLCRGWVEQWWDEAARGLTLPGGEITAYREALLRRWENPRMSHRLAQIAMDGSQKVPVRVSETLRRERTERRSGEGAARIVAAWVCHLRGLGAPVDDKGADRLVRTVRASSLEHAVATVLAYLEMDDPFVAVTVDRLAHDLSTRH